jgi:N-acetylglutamate synthase-like GNAT family acetyltransferase
LFAQVVAARRQVIARGESGVAFCAQLRDHLAKCVQFVDSIAVHERARGGGLSISRFHGEIVDVGAVGGRTY